MWFLMEPVVTGTVPPNTVISLGASGGLVSRLQYLITYAAQFYPEIPELFQDGSFGTGTRNAVIAFQNRFGLTADGVVGPATWAKLYEVYFAAREPVPPPPPTGPVFPGTSLRVGSRGESVRIMQEYLNALATIYPSIPRITADGVFGPLTENAVRAFQRQFGLNPDGVIGPLTWNAIVAQYNRLPTAPPIGPAYPGAPLRIGSRGEDVRIMQQYLNALATVYPAIPRITADGVFGPLTANAVTEFQRLFGLTADGVIGPVTWNAIVTQYNRLPSTPPAGPAFPGTALRVGSRGEDVALMQRYLNALAAVYPSIPRLTADGVFGPLTEAAVKAFQVQFGLTADGVIGPVTWNAIVTQYNNLAVGAAPRTIVLDPGHGGSDPGAVNGARLEKTDNLNMALAVQKILQEQGQKVIMTRSTDVYVPLDERSAISNNNNADIFVSFHRNSFTSPSANGVETLVQTNAPPINITYAQNVQDEIVSAGVQSNRGVRQQNLAVLRNTRAPAMLIELGFISNTRDNELFDQNFDAYAAAIARGIMTSLGTPTTPPEIPPPYFNHTVQSGDTLWLLAQRYGTTVDVIMSLNGLTNSELTVGQILRIPNM